MEGVQLGTIAQCESSLAPFASFNSAFYAFNLPYLFPNRDVAYAFLDGETAGQMKESVIKDGFRILEYLENGFRHTTNSVRPIKAPADLKGLKIRTMENPVHMATYNAMGALATPMAFGELYTALQQKAIDGQENPYANINSNKLYEAQKYITDNGVFYDVTGFFINPDFFDSLSGDLQSNVKEAAEYCKKINREESIKQDKEYKEFLKTKLEFTELTDEQRQAFVDATKSVYDEFRDEIGADTLDKIIKELADINKKMK
ncbi:Solute-binding protein [bioreactor metagenome]|uniref:Solute-binding protein n=1 Tax=bioreactor metagenome TaxID=1076179 RepID=A0A645CQH2_9ZZZZ